MFENTERILEKIWRLSRQKTMNTIHRMKPTFETCDNLIPSLLPASPIHTRSRGFRQRKRCQEIKKYNLLVRLQKKRKEIQSDGRLQFLCV